MDSKFFVPFETAKLCKEKGYPQVYADCYYRDTENNWEMIVSQYTPTEVRIGRTQNQEYIAAPTYHEVVDWLEGKGIYISIMYFSKQGKTWNATVEGNMQALVFGKTTREEALHAAILHALEMI